MNQENGTTEEATNEFIDDTPDFTDDNPEGEQGVEAEVSPDLPEVVAPEKTSDKELNFAKLRTKAEGLEREVQRLAEENKRIAERQYVVDLPEDYAVKVQEADQRLSAIAQKFQDGDVDWEEYQNELRTAQADRERLVAVGLKAEISREMRAQTEQEQIATAKQAWNKASEEFVKMKPDAIDYLADENKLNDLNVYIKAMAADPDNSDKTMEWFLQEAHTLVKAKHRVASRPQPRQSLPINSLSDIPGGFSAPPDETAAMDDLSGSELVRYMRQKGNPDEIEDLIFR